MEEVDNIVIHSLRQIGCDIPNELQTIREFTANMVIEAASKCLHLIKEEINLPTSLPESMSSRFRIGASLASACQDLGYQGEIGYQTFLYSNEHELRKVIMFLIERLPKDTSETVDETLGASVLLNQRISMEMKKQLSCSWTPSYCRNRDVLWQRKQHTHWHFQGTSSHFKVNSCQLKAPKGLSNVGNKLPKELKLYYEKHMPFANKQLYNQRDVAMSIISSNASLTAATAEWEHEWNQAGLGSRLSEQEYRRQKRDRLMKKIKSELQSICQKTEQPSSGSSPDFDAFLSSIAGNDSKPQLKGSRFTHAEKLQFSKDDENILAAMTQQQSSDKADTEEEKQRKREEEINTVKQKLQELASNLENVHSEIKTAKAQSNQVLHQDHVMQTNNKELEDSYRVKKRTLDLLPDADNNIIKLEQLVASSGQRLINLAKQWENHRAPLIIEYRELKAASETRVSELGVKIEEIKQLREKMKGAAEETRNKEDLYKQLVIEYERMTKDVNRSAYTRRILEIVANINKQKQDINKVLIDTRSLQKDINFLSGKLDRTYTVTDELIFKDAKKNEFNRKAYKVLANLHERFSELVKSVEEIGTIMREIRDLEDQVDNLNQNEVKENLQQINKDLQEMKLENTAMISKLKNAE